MEEPKLSPFALTRSRVVLLVLGAVLVLIVISTSMGGLSSYQQLKEAANAAKAGTPDIGAPANTVSP
ncbi:hypothetical protein [Devosia aquimaris]|uniref:hypothetical protein n=1 Tax=Devosia aquimaris TaxID=2866214 RepID=UPI001CD174E8|nr:hypothetical protein [Devosia sp. CJK-A8-3]